MSSAPVAASGSSMPRSRYRAISASMSATSIATIEDMRSPCSAIRCASGESGDVGASSSRIACPEGSCAITIPRSSSRISFATSSPITSRQVRRAAS